jgi:phospho-N-acetylmuramoyl-pentapeptide-transferase
MLNILIQIIPSLILALVAFPFFISFMTKHQEVAKIRKLGPDHASKAGTPSMAGVIFILSTIIGTFVSTVFLKVSLRNFILPLVSVISFGVIGFVDDFLKLLLNRDEGFRFLPKLISQILASTVIWLVLYLNGSLKFAPILMLGFVLFWFVGWSNATNFADGIDGLLGGLSIIIYGGFAFISMQSDNTVLAIFDLAVVGSLIGFMVFNLPKAKIFMGDVGALALGSGLAINSILLGKPLSLLWFGLIFVIETMSVIIQVIGYRFWKKRIFPMAPIHHSFEKYGWSEIKIDRLFWTVQFFLTITGILMWRYLF